MTYYTIYKITNQLNGKFYIGKHQTKDLNDGYMGSGKALREDMKLLGVENFYKEIVEIYDSEEKMNLAESILVVIDSEVSYNKCPGGKGGFGYINENNLNRTYQGKKDNNIKNLVKGQAALRAYYDSGKHKEVMEPVLKRLRERYPNGTFKGKTHSESTKEKMRISAKGKQTGINNSQYGSVWITNGANNRKIKVTEDMPVGWRKGRTFPMSLS
jgi:hypothetical protein